MSDTKAEMSVEGPHRFSSATNYERCDFCTRSAEELARAGHPRCSNYVRDAAPPAPRFHEGYAPESGARSDGETWSNKRGWNGGPPG